MQSFLFLLPGIKQLFKGKRANSLHHLSVNTLSGQHILLSQFKGKKIIVINTASRCGFTPQYRDLQVLHDTYAPKGLVILAFPCNDFANQEPGSNQEIAKFCELNYGLSFKLMEKAHVQGPEQHPLYTWLCKKELNGVMNSKVLWNFQKYLIDESGCLVDVVAPNQSPTGKRITKWLNQDFTRS